MEAYDYKKTYEYQRPKLQTQLVTYKNEINQFSFKGLTPTEYNFLQVMMATAREMNGEPIEMTFDEFKEHTKWKNTAGDNELVKSIKNFNRKIVGKSLEFEDMDGWYHFVPIFKEIWINPKNRGMVFELNDKFVRFFNDIKESFTSYKLEDMTNLKGFYPKEIYRILNSKKGTYRYQQNDGWNVWRVPIETFREFLGIPDKYVMHHITQRVLVPAQKQIMENNLFADMRIEKEKQEKGNKITHIAIFFKTHDQAEKERARKEAEQKAKEQAKKKAEEEAWQNDMLKSLKLGVK